MTEEIKQAAIDKSSEAMKILEEEMRRRKEECYKKLVALLNEYGFQFDVITTLRSNSVSHQIELVPQPRNPQQHRPSE